MTTELNGQPHPRWSSRHVAAGVLALLALTAGVELAMGRHPTSSSGLVRLWVGDVHSRELSQQALDPYSFSHVIHGFVLYAVARAVGRGRWSIGACLVLAVGLECGWEMVENSPWVIARYRQTASADYAGDTVLNSLCDVGSAAVGFALAARLPVWATVATAVVLEVGCAIWIRDDLTLNVIMLVHPFAAVKRWQAGA